MDFGLSGGTKHNRVTLPSLDLGQNYYPYVKTNLIKSDDEDDWWVIGNALLSLSEYTVDYLDSKLFISSVGSIENTSRYNLLGLELRKLTTGNFIVRYVFPELPSSKVSIKEGAIITKINGKNSLDISENEWLKITNTVDTHEICDSTKACWQISAQQIKGYSIH
jgi:C-terminal processing protease CtpA/Prc